MTFDFQAETDPGVDACRCLEKSAPTNPFNTVGYLDAMKRQGCLPWILAIRHEKRLLGGCYAWMRTGRVNRRLQIDSIPPLDHPAELAAFWSGLAKLCSEHQVSFLQLNSYGSKSAVIPPFRHEIWRRRRYEFTVALNDRDLWSLLSSNHRRNIRRAMKSGVEFRRAPAEGACGQHAKLMVESMERRSRRGEAVSTEEDADSCLALVQAGAGEIYQAVHEDAVVSSILVLMSSRGSYYHSAGTSPKGMSLGASHFLIHECCKDLQAQPIETFNLGGVSEKGSGLARFKSGFGSEAVEFESAEVFVGGTFKRTLNRILEALGR